MRILNVSFAIAALCASASAGAQGILLQQDTVDRVFQLSAQRLRRQVRRIVLDTTHWRSEKSGVFAAGLLTRHDPSTSSLPPYWLPGDDLYWRPVWLFCGTAPQWAEDGPDGRAPKLPDDEHPAGAISAACRYLTNLNAARSPDSILSIPLDAAQTERARSLISGQILSEHLGFILTGIDFSLGGLLARTEPGTAPTDYVGMPAAAWFLQAIATHRTLTHCTGDPRRGQCTSFLQASGLHVEIDGSGGAIGALPGSGGEVVRVDVVFQDSCIVDVAARFPMNLFPNVGRGMDDLSQRALRALIGEPVEHRGITDVHDVWKSAVTTIERYQEKGSNAVDWRWSRAHSISAVRRPVAAATAVTGCTAR
jgi:hypothetical protein